jgi:hypothetical protein
MLSENATEANSRTGRAAFNELTLYPMHVMMGEKISNEILPTYGTEKARPLVGEFEDVRMADKQMELNEIVEYSKTHTIAEIREKYYSDDPLGDERDDLLPAQIEATSGGIQEPPTPPTPPGMPAEGTPMEKPETDAANPPKEEPKEDEPTKAMVEEIRQWERKTARIGAKAAAENTQAGFMVIHLPGEVESDIRKALPECKTETAVKMVFERARVRIKPKPAPEVVTTPAPAYDNAALVTLAQSLNNLASAYKSQTTTTPPNIYLPAQTFNMPQTEHVTQIHMPNQPAPQTTVHVTPTVEAAKAPDVHVSSPVNIHQTVEPASPPNIDAPITINQTIEPAAVPAVEIPAPVTNVNIENKMPDQPAPVANVTVENKVEPTPVKFSPTIETPAPVVHVTNEVKTPRIRSKKTKVERDAGNNIEGTTEKFEYEDDK